MTTDLGVVPENGYLLIAPEELPAEIGGIALPEQRSTRPTMGTILASAHPNYEPGQEVVFGQYAGIVVEVAERTVLALDPSEVLARVKP